MSRNGSLFERITIVGSECTHVFLMALEVMPVLSVMYKLNCK